MLPKKQLPGWMLLVLHGLGAAGIAAFLTHTGFSDTCLYLLIAPVLLASLFYGRQVFLPMCGATVLAAAAVTLARNPDGGPAFRNLWVAAILLPGVAEVLHRAIRARLRAEAEQLPQLGLEREARAQAQAARERFAFLARVSDALAGSLDPETTLTQVARQAVPYLADFCEARLLAGEGEEGQVAVAHTNPDREPPLRELALRYGTEWGQPAGEEETLCARVGEEALARMARGDEHLRLLRELRPRSLLAVPLVRKGHVLGTIALGMSESGREYGAGDVELTRELARRAAIAVENARLHQALRDADRRKVEFLAMLAHELRNPLAAISNSGYLLEHSGPDRPGAGRLVGAITRQAKHLARLVDDLLEVSRITQGKLELRTEPVEARAATRSAVDAVRPLLDERRHHLQVQLPEEELWIEADPTRYEQVLVNLLSNAAKYTEPGGQVWVSLETEANRPSLNPQPSTPAMPAHATIRVRDSGIGISPDLLPSIFDLFTQGSAPAEAARGGLGIGLTLVRRLVEQHGGKVTARSEGPGRGSEFVVRWPLSSYQGGRKQQGALPLLPAGNGSSPRGILVVDDDPDAADTLFELLEMWGFRVWLARDGTSGIAAARAHHPAVALLDIGMPGMDGYEVARRLRAGPDTGGMILVALTGYGSEEDRRRSREAGFDHHLVKPADPEELRLLLTRA